MKNERKKYLLITAIGVILIIGIVAAIIIGINNKKQEPYTSPKEDDEYATILEDGSKQNNSQALKQDKKYDDLDITEIQLTEKGNITSLTGKITNNTDKTKKESTATITLIDSKEKEITQMKIYIKELQPQESTNMNVNTTLDYSNAYDFTIKKD